MVALAPARQLHVTGGPFPAALPGQRGPTTFLSPGGTARGVWGKMRARAPGHGAAGIAGLARAAPSSPLRPQPVACPWPLKQGPGKLSNVPRGFTQVPAPVALPGRDFALIWRFPEPVGGNGALLGSDCIPGWGQSRRHPARPPQDWGGCPPTCRPTCPPACLQPARLCPIAAQDPHFCSGPHALAWERSWHPGVVLGAGQHRPGPRPSPRPCAPMGIRSTASSAAAWQRGAGLQGAAGSAARSPPRTPGPTAEGSRRGQPGNWHPWRQV